MIKKAGLNTICTHTGEVKDEKYKGTVSPLYMASAYGYEETDIIRYPRYFNTPNQEALCQKIAALEHAEAALIFGSGMAAISSAMYAFLQQGDHVVLQQVVYGGTYSFVAKELEKFGISYSFAQGLGTEDVKNAIRPNTKMIYIETPSNPLLTITDMKAVATIAKQHGIITMIDNTFASPVNQNPIDFGIDIVMHSATKYLGGHSDICAGAIAASKTHIDSIFVTARSLGGSLSDYTVWLLERSIKTLGIRVKAQNRNAKKVAKYLEKHPDVAKVHYPGLKSHPDYELAKSQMKGFGGMLSFEIKKGLDASLFVKNLKLIKPAISLAGVESTISSPVLTSHMLMSEEERAERGINAQLLRLSVGIEDEKDIIADMEQAFEAIHK